MAASPSVPQYMGRILTSAGDPHGTCFQVAPGYLVTAYHVVQSVFADEDEPGRVFVDLLDFSWTSPVEGWMVGKDRELDLAVIKTETPLPGSIRSLNHSRSAELGEQVVMVGHALIAERSIDPLRWLETTGTWKGGIERESGTRFGHLSAPDALRGMSGSPVRRRSDDSVVGVIVARYNNQDNWLPHKVWVARAEQLHTLLEPHIKKEPWRWRELSVGGVAGGMAGYTVHQQVRSAPEDTVHDTPPDRPTEETVQSVDPGASTEPDVVGSAAEGAEEVVKEAATEGILGLFRWAARRVSDLF